jgi:transposase-like protein
MRYPASDKLEIIRLVQESTLPVRRTLERLGIPRATFYCSDRARRGLVMKQADSALDINIRAAATDARLKLSSDLEPLAINLARAWTRIAR